MVRGKKSENIKSAVVNLLDLVDHRLTTAALNGQKEGDLSLLLLALN